MNLTPGLPFLNIHNPFTNENISVYLDKHNRVFMNTNDYFVKQQATSLSRGYSSLGVNVNLLDEIGWISLKIEEICKSI